MTLAIFVLLIAQAPAPTDSLVWGTPGVQSDSVRRGTTMFHRIQDRGLTVAVSVGEEKNQWVATLFLRNDTGSQAVIAFDSVSINVTEPKAKQLKARKPNDTVRIPFTYMGKVEAVDASGRPVLPPPPPLDPRITDSIARVMGAWLRTESLGPGHLSLETKVAFPQVKEAAACEVVVVFAGRTFRFPVPVRRTG